VLGHHRYEDGSVKVWDVETGTLVLTLNGHRSAVTALHYNASGSLLASGARDTDIIGTRVAHRKHTC
jgi:U3 small nucleolar RNA-associated protein 12